MWPMDEESLVTPLGAEEKSVAHKIFEAALEKNTGKILVQPANSVLSVQIKNIYPIQKIWMDY